MIVVNVTNKVKFGAMQNDAVFDLKDFLPYLLNLAAEEVSLGFEALYKERYGMLHPEWRSYSIWDVTAT